MQQTKRISQPDAIAITYQLLGDGQPKIPSILSQASEMCDTYFKEKNLDKLLAGTTAVKNR